MRTRVPSASLQLVLGGAGVGIDCSWAAAATGGGRLAADKRLGFADREAAGDDVARDAALRGLVGERRRSRARGPSSGRLTRDRC